MTSWNSDDQERVREDLLERFPAWPDGSKEWPERMPCNARPFVLFIGISSGASPMKGSNDMNREQPRASRDHLVFGAVHPNFDYEDGRQFFRKLSELARAIVATAEPTFPSRDCLRITSLLNLGLGYDGTATRTSTDDQIIEWVSSVTEKMTPPAIVGCGLKGIFSNRNKSRAWANGGSRFTWHDPWSSEIPVSKHHKLRWKPVTYSSGARGHVYLLPNHPSRYPLTTEQGWQNTITRLREHFVSVAAMA